MTVDQTRTIGAVPLPSARTAGLAAAGLVGATLSVVLVGLLHVVVGPDQVDPVRRTISEYALGEYRLLFDAGVLALAVGSAVVLAALIGAGLLRALSTASLLLATWSVALVVVVVFQKIDWSVGPTLGGYVHRYASLLAFLSLPLAALLLAARWRRDPRWRRHASTTGSLSLVSLAWLTPILAGFALRPLTGIPWWRIVPLGLVERGLAVTEVALVLTLALWALSARPTRPTPPRVGLSECASRGLAVRESGSGGARVGDGTGRGGQGIDAAAEAEGRPDALHERHSPSPGAHGIPARSTAQP